MNAEPDNRPVVWTADQAYLAIQAMEAYLATSLVRHGGRGQVERTLPAMKKAYTEATGHVL